MNEKSILEEINTILKNSKSEIVATKKNLEEASNFAIELIRSSSEDLLELNVRVALLVYNNTLISALQRDIRELEGMG